MRTGNGVARASLRRPSRRCHRSQDRFLVSQASVAGWRKYMRLGIRWQRINPSTLYTDSALHTGSHRSERASSSASYKQICHRVASCDCGAILPSRQLHIYFRHILIHFNQLLISSCSLYPAWFFFALVFLSCRSTH